MEVPEVRSIVLDQVSVGSIHFDPSVAEIFYFKHDKHDIGDYNVINLIIFIGNPVVDKH